jgi:hypothetical protein
MAAAWWVMILMSGWRSNRPSNTRRVMAAVVSYGQPNTCQIQYFEWSSPR